MTTERFDPTFWGNMAVAEYVLAGAEELATAPRVEQVLRGVNVWYTAASLADSMIELRADPRFPEEAKDAICVAMVAQLMGGVTVLADLPMYYEQAWEYLNDLPEFIGDMTKEEFMDYLEETYPDHFQRNPLDSGKFLEPPFIDNPTGPDFSPYDVPLIPASFPAPGSQGPFASAPNAASPVVLDLDGDGVELTTYNDTTTTTFFDIDGDGFAQRTAWVGSDDGLLARDLDESGAIEAVDELFGSPSVDGFALLAALDDNGDHVINQYDDAWSDLIIWKDANGDAVSQSGELHTLASLNIVSIDLAGVTASSSTINGNPISHTSTYTLSGGTTRAAADAWFINSKTSTYDIVEYTLNEETLSLPGLRGSGQISDLFIAMSRDEDLFDLVREFTDNWDISRFEDGAALDSEIADILWRWAGVDSVSPTSRGPNIDARNLAFLEKYFAESFLQWGTNPNPNNQAARLLEESWQAILNHSKAQLMMQISEGFLFDPSTRFDIWTGLVEGDMDLSQDAVDDLEAAAPSPGAPLVEYWEEVARYLEYTKGLSNLTGGELTMLDNAVVATDSSLSWEDIMADAVLTAGSTYNGTSSGETLTGGVGDDTINGFEGADTINAGQGHDIVYAGDGNDTANGELGHDELHGGDGNDTLSGGTGNDEIWGEDGNDTINGNDDDDLIYAGGGDDIVHGNDGDDILWSTSGSDELYGDDGADELHGSSWSNDVLIGGAGDDTVLGDQGDDEYRYNSGNDAFSDYLGADKIVMPVGVDSGDLSFYRTQEGTGDGTLFINVDGLGSIESSYFFTNSYGYLHSWRLRQ